MSYSILYRAIAIKSEKDPNRFLIISESGDNNVFDAYSPKKRYRSWSHDVFAHRQNFDFLTWEEIVQNVSELDFESGCYAVSGKNRTLKDHLSVYRRAVKNAKTLTELKELNCSFYVKYSLGGNIEHFNFSTENELEGLDGEIKDKAGYKYISPVWINYSEIIPKVSRKRGPKKPITDPCMIRIEGKGYFLRKLKYGFRYTLSPCDLNTISRKRAVKLIETVLSEFKCEIV